MPKKNLNLHALLNRLQLRRNEPKGVVIDTPLDLKNYLPFRFHRLSVLLAFESAGTFDQTGKSDLKVRDWRLLVLLASLGPLTNREIAELANMNATTISRAMSHLTKLGLVISGSDINDKRKTINSLNQEGARLYNSLAVKRLKSIYEVEKHISKEEKETLYRIFDKIESRVLDSNNDEQIKYD